MLEVAINDHQWTVVGDMAIKVLALKDFATTFVGALHWVRATYGPVVGGHILESRIVIFTVLAAERPLQAFFILMDLHIGTLKRLIAVKTLDLVNWHPSSCLS